MFGFMKEIKPTYIVYLLENISEYFTCTLDHSKMETNITKLGIYYYIENTNLLFIISVLGKCFGYCDFLPRAECQ